MKILALKPGHDGAAAYIDDGQLLFSLEAEKDSFPRHSEVSAQLIAEAMEMAPDIPDVLAVGGWHKDIPNVFTGIMTGYEGLDKIFVQSKKYFGRTSTLFSSSHEMSHIFMATAMAPWAPIKECIVLVWEGVIGAFYHWREYGREVSRISVLTEPGARYGALFALADPEFPEINMGPTDDLAGKLMALAGWALSEKISADDQKVVESLLNVRSLYPFKKADYRDSGLYNCGVHTKRVHAAARYLTDRLFQIFYEKAKSSLPRKLPIVISGGCGLNCEWNRRWSESGIFSKTFVPPCANDSGSAIGTAAHAMAFFGEPCRLDWSVYTGAPFIHDSEPSADEWNRQPLNFKLISQRLAEGRIFAWVQGRCEIGPRALGHRSILASPLLKDNKDILNKIKQREDYRPIAPCCLYEDLNLYFDPAVEDPYMLYFSHVKNSALPAITHVDGTARVQSVRVENEPVLYNLLKEFKTITGYGVLCNTSLNFKGTGFINRTFELLKYCEQKNISDVVIEDSWYSHK